MKRIYAVFPDLNGCLRGKYIPEDKFKQKTQIKSPRSVLTQDIEGEEIDVLESYSIQSGDRDLIYVPNKKTMVSWKTGRDVEYVMCDVADESGELLTVSPRTILKDTIDVFSKAGYEVKVATEIEFYLTNIDDNNDKDEAVQPYGDLNSLDVFDGVLQKIVENTQKLGLNPDSLLNEAGNGQFELTFEPMDPISMADKTCLFKQMVRDTARSHGASATFMAKPRAFDESSSQHIHISVSKDGENIMQGDNPEGDNFIAGQQAYGPEASLFFCPNVNSFRRVRMSHGYVPNKMSAGDEDRSTALRVTGGENNTHLEHRLPGADSNPYLVIAAIIAAGYSGIEKSMTIERDQTQLPEINWNMHEAIHRLNQSDFFTQAFGEEFITLFTSIKQNELLKYERIISDWELRNYGPQI